MTKREAILQALKAKLIGIPGVDDENVFRSRVEAVSRAKSPAISVEPLNDVPNIGMTSAIDWALLARISIDIRADVPDQAADPIIEDVFQKVMSDTSLGGLSMDIEPANVTFDLQEADLTLGIISLDFRIRYRTGADSMSV